MTKINEAIEAIEAEGGEVYIIGGAVRDVVMNRPADDIDVEVFGMDIGDIVRIVRRYGSAQVMGARFPIVGATIDGEKVEFAVASADTPVIAAARRDFTMNAMYSRDGRIFDFFGGRRDIEAGVIRHVGASFYDDPCRVYRAARFSARFGFTVAPETIQACRNMENRAGEVPAEMAWKEWSRIVETENPGAAVRFVADVWPNAYPEISGMVGVEQNPIWHPEGDAFEHTCAVVDAAADICRRDGIDGEDRWVVMFGAICHDFGKAVTTVRNERGDWASPGHAEAGVEIARAFMQRIGAPERIVEQVCEMVAYHMSHVGGSRRVARRVASAMRAPVRCIAAVIEADHSGRAAASTGMPETGAQFVADVEAARVEFVQPFVMGRHMIDRGFRPGPRMGAAIRAVFAAQVDGVVTSFEEAIEFAVAQM